MRSAAAPTPVAAFHHEAAPLCVARLREALNPASGLFDRQLRNGAWDKTQGTEDLTSTAICLIGLSRAGIHPFEIEMNVERTLGGMVQSLRSHRYWGGLGLVIWANAVWNGPALDDLLKQAGYPQDAPIELIGSLTTMETAWLVSGLLHECKRPGSAAGSTARKMLDLALRELLDRYESKMALFRHASNHAPLRHRLRKWVANFADQIYSVQALSFAAISTGDERALAAADGCANRLVQLQGDRGQWWWHYDPRDGRVAQAYPVYSVHQHGMAPMALMALDAAGDAAGGANHHAAIARSHEWIAANELGQDLFDRERGTIWRDIERDEAASSRLLRKARSFVGWKSDGAADKTAKLRINQETRPYEWAWCLYAGAIADGTDPAGHIV